MSTRFDAETILYGRFQGALHFVYQRGTDPQTGDVPVTNRDIIPSSITPTPVYSDPLGYGLRMSGHAPGNQASIVDSDIAAVTSGTWDLFVDIATYQLGLNILASFSDVQESDFGRSVSYGQYADRLQKRVDALEVRLKPFLNPLRQGASSGTIRNIPATAFIPRWQPGYTGRGGYGQRGGWGC